MHPEAALPSGVRSATECPFHSATLYVSACMRMIHVPLKCRSPLVCLSWKGKKEEERQYHIFASQVIEIFSSVLIKVDFCFWNVCVEHPVFVYTADSGPQVHSFFLPRHNWQRNPGARLARIACCSTVWHPKHWRPGSFYSWHEHVCVWVSVWECFCVCVCAQGERV